MVPPIPTKACTVPHCDGRMTLKIHETRDGSSDGNRLWECDVNAEHVDYTILQGMSASSLKEYTAQSRWYPSAMTTLL
jgi:hypothetical protein